MGYGYLMISLRRPQFDLSIRSSQSCSRKKSRYQTLQRYSWRIHHIYIWFRYSVHFSTILMKKQRTMKMYGHYQESYYTILYYTYQYHHLSMMNIYQHCFGASFFSTDEPPPQAWHNMVYTANRPHMRWPHRNHKLNVLFILWLDIIVSKCK